MEKTPNETPDTTVLSDFLDEHPEALIIRCLPNKHPFQQDFCKDKDGKFKPRPPKEELIHWASTEGKLGLVPGTANCAAIDIDTGTKTDWKAIENGDKELLEKIISKGEAIRDEIEKILDANGITSRAVRSEKPGRYHIYVASEGDIPNITWRDGEVRCTGGYIVMHHLDAALKAISQLQETADTIDEAKLRKILPQVRENAANTEGGRNNTLNKEYYHAKMEGDSQRQREAIQAARDAGLSEKEIAKTIKSADKAVKRTQAALAREAIVLSKTEDGTLATCPPIYQGTVARGELAITAGESGSRKTTYVIGSFTAALKDNPELTCAWFCSDATQPKSKGILESAGFQWSKQIAFYAWKPPKKGELDSRTLKLTIERAKAEFGGKLDLVVLDSMADVLLWCGDAFLSEGREVDLNTQPHSTKAMSWLVSVATEYQVAMELICHPSKGSPTSAPFHSTLPQHAEISRFTYSLNQQDFAEKKILNKTVMAAWLSHGAEHLLHVKKNRGGNEGKYMMEFGNGAVILNEMTKPKGNEKVDYESRILEYLHEKVEAHKRHPVKANLLPRTVTELAKGVGGKTAYVKAAATRMLKKGRDGEPAVLTNGACCRHIHDQVHSCIHVCGD